MPVNSASSRTALLLIRDLVAARLGVVFDDNMIDVLHEKISPLVVDRGFPALLDYYYFLKYDQQHGEEWPRLMDAISVRESYFWREVDQIQALVTLMPSLVKAFPFEPVRIWSAACAGGEEPLSIAIALNEAAWFDKHPIEIYASDASPRSIQMAREGIYRDRSFRALPAELKDKYFTRESNGWRVNPSIHQRICWAIANLCSESEIGVYATSQVVFCRNVFIYFSEAAMRQTVGTFYDKMRTPGYLFVGAAESLLKLATAFELKQVGTAFVYVKQRSQRESMHA